MSVSNLHLFGKRGPSRNLVYMPRPLTHDAREIRIGRLRSIKAYRDARTRTAKESAFALSQHWKWLHRLAGQMRRLHGHTPCA